MRIARQLSRTRMLLKAGFHGQPEKTAKTGNAGCKKARRFSSAGLLGRVAIWLSSAFLMRLRATAKELDSTLPAPHHARFPPPTD